MKKIVLLYILGLSFSLNSLFSQDHKVFVSGSTEMIFSFATIEYTDPVDGNLYTGGNIMRWAPVLNLQGMLNFDPAKAVGFFTGLTVRNVGFIYKEPGSNIKKKYRTYNIGIPIGIKLGNMNSFFIYGGYEIEFPFNYKEKTFIDNSKRDVFVDWFGSRAEQIQHSFMVGFNFPYGFNIKLKYYITNFHNQDYVGTDPYQPDLGPHKLYEGLKSNIIYFSLNIGLFNKPKKYYSKKTWEETYR